MERRCLRSRQRFHSVNAVSRHFVSGAACDSACSIPPLKKSREETMSLWRKILGAAFSVGVGAAFAASAGHAQDYPSKPIKILVPTAAGGIADQIARIISQHLTDSAKQTVVVENRT